ncbi:MAG: NAD(P)H-hydrate dehydratase [Eubacteriaceae bacterium]|nr:NAD(P)H-hydrate dehydratase [Eubacteriaceae bacterium]
MDIPLRVDDAMVKELIGYRDPLSHKGTWGYIALIGGSLRYSGAEKLANIAACAVRSGAGVVKLATASSIARSVIPYLLESTLFPLSDRDGSIVFERSEIDELVSGTKAVGIGMGIGPESEAGDIIRYLLGSYRGSLLIDADGLNAVSRMGAGVLDNSACRVVLTPHMKEFSRLCGRSVEEITASPLQLARDFAAAHGVTVLLKGTETVITDGKRSYLSDTGCPGMATAGSGDVLSGILTALLGYLGDRVLEAAAAAAYINGKAGMIAQSRSNAVCMSASDTAWAVKDALIGILS